MGETMKILFILILHHFGDIQPVVIPAKNKAEACAAAKSWTNPRGIGASSYATAVVAVEGQANGAISGFLYEISCENMKTDEWVEYAATVGTGCRQFLSAYDEIMYLEKLSADLETVDVVRDHANTRITSLRTMYDRKADWQKYFICVSERVRDKMSDSAYIDLLDDIDKRITEIEKKLLLRNKNKDGG